jgi:MFS family permease
MRVFFVEAAVDAGSDLAVAGFVLAGASVVAIVTRLYGGWRSDAVPRHPYVSAALLMFAGSAGYVLMAFAEGTLLLAAAAVLGISAGWGWSGLVQLGTVRAHPESPGAASAFIHFGSLFGSLIGPVLFGLLLAFGFPVAWITSAGIAATGGILMLVGGRGQTAGTSTRIPSAADR